MIQLDHLLSPNRGRVVSGSGVPMTGGSFQDCVIARVSDLKVLRFEVFLCEVKGEGSKLSTLRKQLGSVF